MSTALLMARRPRNLQFAAAVQRIVGKRSNRDVMLLTGVSHTYVGDWRFGCVPSFKKLGEFVEGCRETAEEEDPPGIRLSDSDVRELYRAAGYLPPEDRAGAPLEGERRLSPDERLGVEMMRLKRELNYPGPVTLRRLGGRQNLTHADVDDILAGLREDILRELEEERRRGETGK